jgi:iron complex outermembrane receptor protein
MHPHLRLAAVAAAVVSAFSVQAQQPASNTDEATVIVTADRFATATTSLPIGVTVITAADIAASTATTVPEVLAKLGGVQVRNNAGDPNSQIDLRGFGMSGDQNTLILLDGQRISETELVPAQLAGIPLEAIDHIEILRGSGAVLYGAGATAGTINVVTRKAAADRRDATLAAMVGSYGSSELRAGITASGERIGLSLHAGSMASDNYRRNNHVANDNLEGDLRWRFADGDVGVKFGSSREKLGLPSYRTEAQLASDPRGTATPDDHGSTSIWHAGITGRMSVGAAEWAADLDFRNKKASSALFSVYGDYSVNADTDRWTFSPRIRLTHQGPGGDSELVAGVDHFDWTYRQNNLTTGPYGSAGAAAATQRSDALYVEERLALTASAQLNAGLRLQQQRDQFTLPASAERSIGLSAFELALRQKLAERLALEAKWGQSFRTATVDENYSAFTNAVALLRPQKSHDAELGVAYGSGANRLRAALFASRISDEIHLLVVPNTLDFGFGMNTNLSPTRREGIELEGRARPIPQLDLSANYRLVRAEFRSGSYDGVDLTGKEVPLVPRQLFTANAAWRIVDGSQLAGTWRHVGEQRYDNDQVNTFRMMPSYDLFDLKFRQDLRTWWWSLAVDNLFDKRYYSYAIRNGAGTTFNAYPELGRRIMLSGELRL